jgi:hypothetical protein
VSAKRRADGDHVTLAWAEKQRGAVATGSRTDAEDERRAHGGRRSSRASPASPASPAARSSSKKKTPKDDKEPSAFDPCGPCRRLRHWVGSLYGRGLETARRSRSWTLFWAWLLLGWGGGHFAYVGEWSRCGVRLAALAGVYGASKFGLAFCVAPVLVVAWVADWHALPDLLWR